MKRTSFILFISLCITFVTIGQDHHFSNYSFAPLQLNPSMCGSFVGKTRIGVIYREQWSQFIQTPFQTANLFFDYSLKGIREYDWVSFGAQVIADQAGDLNYQFNQVSPSLAYHFTLKSKSTKVISIGAELSLAQHISGNNDFRFGDELAGQVTSSADREYLTDYSEGNSSFNLGINYQSISKRNTQSIIGLGVQNILKPKFGTFNRINPRYNIHFTQQYQVNKTSTFLYSAFTSIQGKASNINLQIHYGFKFENDSPYTFTPGLGYRINDALQLLLKVDYNLWSAYLGYDITISTARVYNNGRGALELGLCRVLLNYKKPTVTPILLCPRI